VDQEIILSLFTSGFSFNVPKIVNAFEAEIRKAVAILDIEAWATHLEQLWQGIRTYRLF
jgi:hypothetical protein